MKPQLFFIIFIVFSFYACEQRNSFDCHNFKVVGKPGARGLENNEGELVLDTVYLFLNIKSDIQADRPYLKYTSNDGRKGIYVDHLKQPYFELGQEYNYLKTINSFDYFAFAGNTTDQFGNSLEGIIDKEKNIILQPEYRSILYYGGKYFYASNPTDKLYSIFDLQGKLVENTGRYAWVYTNHGVTFASKQANGQGDIWGAKRCLLDENAKEITEHIYQNIAILKSDFHEKKVYLSMRKDNIQTLYYPNGKLIYPEEFIDITPIAMNSDRLAMQKEFHSKVNKNLVGILNKDGVRYYLTYEGELLNAEVFIENLGI